MIIDFHTHLFPPSFRENRQRLFEGEPAFRMIYGSAQAKLAGASDLLRHMDEAGIQKSIVFGFPWEKTANFQRHNDYIMDMVARYPDRFIGFCCFSPLSFQAAREAERCLRGGLSGVGELAVYAGGMSRSVVDAYVDIMAVCHEWNVPVLIHTNEPVGHHYPGKAPMTLREIYHFIKSFPHNRLVLAHWGGGIFFYALMRKEVRDVLKNVWFDTAASPFLYRPDVYRLAGELVGYEKILFGTDYPLLPAKRYFQEMASSGISEENKNRVLGGNAEDLLGIASGNHKPNVKGG
ncbi:MAG: amidohydrolase [Deltaproteobacteria bacterium]|nr:MAG: amidohydrolase [Deltaproteobacteria bacterium]